MKLDDPERIADLRGRWPPEWNYLIGVSGGRDSVALLHLLHNAGYENLVVCHLNHQLRGKESKDDAEFVRDLADQFGYDCEVSSTDVRSLAVKEKLSIETAGRQARHEFFFGILSSREGSPVFLAHHADDQVETIIFNLCRGAGLPGLSGIPSESGISRPGCPSLIFIRPLMRCWGEEIDNFIRDHEIEFRVDSTNAEVAESTRNRIRHELIPLMVDIFQRDSRGAVFRTGELAAEEDIALEHFVDFLWAEVTEQDSQILANELLNVPIGMQRRIIRRWLMKEPLKRSKGKEPIQPAIGFREIEAIREILPPDAPVAKINLPGGWHARRREGRVFLQAPGG